MDKEELRVEYKKRRSEQSLEVCAAKSLAICDRIKDWNVFKEAKSVAVYMFFHKEVDLRNLLDFSKDIAIPKVGDNDIKLFRIYSLDQTRPGYMQIREPDETCNEIRDVDLALIPGICFSLSGGRIGFGKGNYDKLLKNLNCVKVGIGYDLQVVDDFAVEEHDVSMDYIITENRIIRCEDG